MNNTTDGNIYSTQMIKPMALPKSHTDERILAAIDYIHKNLYRHLYTEMIAENVYMSRSHFCKLFRKEMGQCPSDFINDLRLERAKQLLKDSEYSVEAIALACGFNSHSYFSASFKKRLSVSPTEYRNIHAV